jgi:hypothetical protein
MKILLLSKGGNSREAGRRLVAPSLFFAPSQLRADCCARLLVCSLACVAGNLLRGLVSCTGAQFCPLALIETKNRALELVRQLEEQLDIPSLVRMHWTGCPNSCGQVRRRVLPACLPACLPAFLPCLLDRTDWSTLLPRRVSHASSGFGPACLAVLALPEPFLCIFPASFLQAQVGDIGLMGAPAKLDGKAVEGVKVFLGGKIGENPEVRQRRRAASATLAHSL